jgi:mono/diheme cytochrome c family protein
MTLCRRAAALSLALILASGIGSALARAEGGDPADAGKTKALEFFERHVRPLLVERCQSCHGAKKQEAGLRLDSALGVKTGGDSGPLIIAGDPDHSPLLEVIRYDGDTKMPPKGKLSDPEIAALTELVRLGAPWPDEAVPTAKTAADKLEASKRHWAFQPISRPQIPAVNDGSWVKTPIDAFILSRLDQAGLKPSPTADRRTLIRRATFDLHGLPATPDEIIAFEADDSPEAFQRVVNRLLESPRYGERWGRFWLDVARYADTKGYVRLSENPMYPSSWTYRDYVIRAFNEDLPYDRFLREQLAADRLDLGDDPRPLAALGFLTLGQRFINSQNDIIDDRIDVVTRGLMGLTVACARCHDHKFDAIPTRDYYSLHGVFASSLEPRVPPLLLRDFERASYEPYLTELKKRTDGLDAFLNGQRDYLLEGFRARAGEYLLAGQSEEIQPNFLAIMFLIDANKDLNPVMTQRWAGSSERPASGIIRFLGRGMISPGSKRSMRSPLPT